MSKDNLTREMVRAYESEVGEVLWDQVDCGNGAIYAGYLIGRYRQASSLQDTNTKLSQSLLDEVNRCNEIGITPCPGMLHGVIEDIVILPDESELDELFYDLFIDYVNQTKHTKQRIFDAMVKAGVR